MSNFYRISDLIIKVDGYYLDEYREFISEDVEIPDAVLKVEFDKNVDCVNEYINIDNIITETNSSNSKIVVSYFDEISQNKIASFISLFPFKESILNIYINSKYITEYLFYISFFDLYKINLVYNSGINLHASAIKWRDKGIIFTAPSETGKTTQAKLWQKYENAKIVNGDRPTLTVFNNQIKVHGTPWSGSDPIITKLSVTLSCIVVLEQAKYNELNIVPKVEAVSLLLPRFFIPRNNEFLIGKSLDIIESIIERVPIYKLKCLPDIGAVEILKNEMSLLE